MKYLAFSLINGLQLYFIYNGINEVNAIPCPVKVNAYMRIQQNRLLGITNFALRFKDVQFGILKCDLYLNKYDFRLKTCNT